MIRRLTFAALDGRAHNIGLFGGVVCNVRSVARKWPVVRRETEYSTIRSVLDGQSQVGGIVVIGDAGVGKTTPGDPVAELSGALGRRYGVRA